MNEPQESERTHEAAQDDPERLEPDETTPVTRVPLAIGLFALTLLSTTYVGSLWEGSESLLGGLTYSAPLMAILLAHEFGHYIAARIHRVPASLPYFVPMPLPPLGTMGAVILMPGSIRNRNALLDIGAAGPLAGMAVALPVLIYGIATSPTGPEPSVAYLMEGKSLLYMGLLYAIKGPLPAGHDILLSPMAFAGWAGLLVTMINLIPALQLDGGHVAHALLGDRSERLSRLLRRLIFPFAIVVALGYGLPAFFEGKRGDALWSEVGAGGPWLTWGLLMYWMARRTKREHPATDGDAPLSPRRRWVARLTLALFVLLFMPAWLREVHPLSETTQIQQLTVPGCCVPLRGFAPDVERLVEAIDGLGHPRRVLSILQIDGDPGPEARDLCGPARAAQRRTRGSARGGGRGLAVSVPAPRHRATYGLALRGRPIP